MNIEQIIESVVESPQNTNPNILRGQLNALVADAGGGGKNYPEVDSAIINGGFGWIEEGQPHDEVVITWNGNLEGKERYLALNYLLNAPDDLFAIKMSDDVYENYDPNTWLPQMSFKETDWDEGVFEEVYCPNNLEYIEPDSYTVVYKSAEQDLVFALCTETHKVDTGEELLSLPKGIYFFCQKSLNEEIESILYTSKLLIYPSSRDQESIRIQWDGNTTDKYESEDLENLWNNFYHYAPRQLYKISDSIDMSFFDLLYKEIVLTYNDGNEVQPIDFTVKAINSIYTFTSPSLKDIYLIIGADPLAVIVLQDINTVNPTDPSQNISIPSGIYFTAEDDNGVWKYTSKLVLQEENHIKEEIHKIDNKFISGPMFIYAPFDSSIDLYVMDKTLGEIKEAYNSNVPMFFNIGNYQYPSRIRFYLDENAITCYVAESQEGSNNLVFWAYSFTADSDNDYPTAPPVII